MNEVNVFYGAIKAGDLKKIKWLLDEYPSLLRSKRPTGESPILLAKYYGHSDLIDFFLSKNINLNIFEAAAIGAIDTIRFLIQRDAEIINSYSHDGFTPLHLATFFGHELIVQTLLENGANANVFSKNTPHVMPLHSAVAGRRIEITRMLLIHGADVNALQQGGHTPLHGAAFNGQLEMVELLVGHGADIYKENDEGKTPYTIAKEMANIEIMNYLRLHQT